MEVTNQIVTYNDIEKDLIIEGDDYGIASRATQKAVKETFLSNPFLEDKSSCMVYLSRVDGVVGGREIFFPTRAKLNGVVVNSLGASSLMVLEKFRPLALGADISLYPILNCSDRLLIYAGISKMALPLYRKMGFYDLASPILWQPRDSRFVFEALGIKGVLLSILKSVCNMFLTPFISLNNKIAEFRRGKSITIQELGVVPHWVDDIISADKHDFMEFHNHQWMQWVLTHNFNNRKKDKQSFYAIYMDDKEIGFYLTKERECSIPEKHIDEVVFGSIIEWGSYDEKVLSELDIIKIALTRFSKDVDIVQLTTTNKSVAKKLRRFGFIRHGENHIVVKPLAGKNADLKQIERWRIRLGYGDEMFS